MAEDNEDIMVRLDEIEKLQAELRHLVPRVTSSSSGRQEPPRDSRASIRFPSLFTFPIIKMKTKVASNPPRNERVQRSAARLNLNGKPLSGDRRSAISPRNAEGSSQDGTTNVLKNLLRSGNVTSSRARNSSASSSAADSRTPARSGAVGRPAEVPQGAIKKGLRDEITAARDKRQRATDGRANVRLSGNENTLDIPVHGTEATRPLDVCLKNRHCNRSGSIIERIMEELNYCFVDDKRVTVPYHHLGSKAPRRVRMLRSFKIEGTETPRLHESVAKMSVN